MATFKDVKVGDLFQAGGIRMVKIRDNTEADQGRPLSRRKPNAINLENRHHIVVGDKLPVILIERR